MNLYSRCPECNHANVHREITWERSLVAYRTRCTACRATYAYPGDDILTADHLLEKKSECCAKVPSPRQRVEDEERRSAAWEAAEQTATYNVQRVKCGNRYCSRCCTWRGVELRERLRDRIRSWSSVYMLTLTADPKYWDDKYGDDGPRQLLLYIRKRRAISRTIRELARLGLLKNREYFLVVEWHKSGYPHWHLLLQTNYLDINEVHRVWGLNRPKDAGPPEQGRPLFGFCMYSKRRMCGSHAANYATKYLIKPPDEDYPDWVLDFEGRIPRYSASRGFWGTVSQDTSHPTECFCEVCREEEPDKVRVEQPTIRKRVSQCQTTACVVKTVKVFGVEFRKFFGACHEPWATIADQRGWDPDGETEPVGRKSAEVLCGYRESNQLHASLGDLVFRPLPDRRVRSPERPEAEDDEPPLRLTPDQLIRSTLELFPVA